MHLLEQLPAPARKAVGGRGGGLEFGLAENYFLDRRSSCEDRLDRSGAFKRAVCRGKLGTSRGKIVDCRGCLGVRMLVSVGYRVGSRAQKKEKDLINK